MPFIQFEPFTTTFEAESTIYQKEVRCQVSENDFNYTLNPSAIRSGTSGSYIDAVTGSEFRPYATTVGIYNDADELFLLDKILSDEVNFVLVLFHF